MEMDTVTFDEEEGEDTSLCEFKIHAKYLRISTRSQLFRKSKNEVSVVREQAEERCQKQIQAVLHYVEIRDQNPFN